MHAYMLSHVSSVQLYDPGNHSPPASLSTGFSRQEYWSRLQCSSPENLPNPGIEPVSLTSPALAGGFLPPVPAGKHCGGADVDLQGDLPQHVADTCLPGLLLLVPVPVAGH